MAFNINDSGLGMGVAFALEDQFSQTASVIEQRMSSLEGSTDAMARSIDNSMNQIKLGMASAATGAAILAPFLSGVQAASDLEENINKVQVSFKEASDDIIDFSNRSLEAFGVTGSQALEMASLFGDMGTSLGQSTAEAAVMSETLVGLAGDLSSFKNISIERAQSALRGIYTGETRALKDLGIVLNETTLKQTAQELGIRKSIKSMTEAEKVNLRYQAVMKATANAQGDFARTSDSFANSQRVFEGTLGDVSESLGAILLPLLARAMQLASEFLKGLKAFVDSPVGGVIMRIVAALGALLSIGGLVLVLMGTMRFAVFQLAKAFTANTQAMIINTIAQKGIIAGLKVMTRQAWLTIAPFAAIAVKLALIAAAGKLVFDLFRAGFKGFEEQAERGGKPVEGISGFFIKLAGIIQGVSAIWQSWNGETFALTESMARKLENLGILDFVIALGTWAVRVKEFFAGVFVGLSEGFTFIQEIASATWQVIKGIFSPIGEFLDSLGFSLGRNTSAIEKWKTAGKVAGLVLVGIFTALAIAAGVAAISMIIAFAPVLLTIAAVAAGIWLVIEVVQFLGEAFTFVGELIVSIWDSVTQAVFDFFSFMFSLPKMMFDAGVNFVKNLWEGIKSMWGQLVAWFSEKVNALISPITSLFGGEEGVAGSAATDNIAAPVGNNDATHHAVTSKNPAVGGGTTNNTTNNNSAPVTAQFIIDSDLIAEKVIEQQQLKDARD